MAVGEKIAAEARQPKRKVYHGWYVVVVGCLAGLGYSTSLSSTLSVFFKPMSEQFGWPRIYLSGVRSFESLFSGVVAYFMGPLLDRHGTRTVIVAGSILSGITLILLGFVGDSLQFFLLRGIALCIGTSAISHMVVSVAVSNWFVRYRGRALGLSNAGTSLGKIIMAPLITLLMVAWGWREAWVVLGVMVLLLVPLPAALFVRRRPEDLGLRPDGDEQPGASIDVPSHGVTRVSVLRGSESVWTRGEAVRTSAFWLIVAVFGAASIGQQGFALHMIPFLTDIGLSPAMAAGALSTLAAFQLAGNLGWGFVVERFSVRYMTMGMFLANATGVAMMAWQPDAAVVVVGLVTYGFSMSGISVLQDLIWANYFGRLSLGAVRGLGMPLLVVLSSGAPLFFGYLYDVTGGYQIALASFAAVLLLAAGLVLACRPPKKPQQPEVAHQKGAAPVAG